MCKKYIALILRYKERLVCRFRRIWFRLVLKECGVNLRVLGRVKISRPENVRIGDNCSLNENVFINARTEVSIGENCHLSPYVVINSGGLDYTKKGSERRHVSEPVTISDGVWLGAGVLVNPGVSIGENSVIGAGAVVTKNIPANSVAVGVPAKVVKEIV